MNKASAATTSPTRPWVPSLLLGSFALLAIQLGAYAVGAWPPFDGTFTGPDSYMRLHRILECLGGVACESGVLERSNAPYGDALHWPWLWDWMILAVSAPFQLFLPLRTALVVAAYVTGPILGVATLLLLTLAARQAGVGPALPYVGLLMVAQPHVTFLFSYARPDHHAIQAAAYAGALLATLAGLATQPRWAARSFGLAFGLGVWLSTEGLITAVPLLTSLGLLWILRGDRSSAAFNLEAMTWTAGTAGLALLIDPPIAGRLSIEFDRISIVHLALFCLMAGFWATTRAGSDRRSSGTGRRLLWALAGGAGALVLMNALFPGFHRGPAADMAEPLWTLWLEHTAEYVPLIRRSDATEVLMAAVPALLAIPLALWAARSRTGTERGVWFAVAGALAWFQVLATFQQVRWSTYVHLIATLPLAWLLGMGLRRVGSARVPVVRSLLRAAVVCVIALGPVLTAAGVGLAAGRTDYQVVDRCEPTRIIDELAELRAPNGGPAVILGSIFWGPEILWRTGHGVVATPYHRNTSGIMDSHAIMSADPAGARSRLTERGITHVAVCTEIPWLPLVRADESPGSFYASLVRGSFPEWVSPLGLPADASGLALFAIDQESP